MDAIESIRNEMLNGTGIKRRTIMSENSSVTEGCLNALGIVMVILGIAAGVGVLVVMGPGVEKILYAGGCLLAGFLYAVPFFFFHLVLRYLREIKNNTSR